MTMTPFQYSEREKAKSSVPFSQNTPSQMCHRVLYVSITGLKNIKQCLLVLPITHGELIIIRHCTKIDFGPLLLFGFVNLYVHKSEAISENQTALQDSQIFIQELQGQLKKLVKPPFSVKIWMTQIWDKIILKLGFSIYDWFLMKVT